MTTVIAVEWLTAAAIALLGFAGGWAMRARRERR